MSLRLPQNLSSDHQIETGASILDAEILAEKAAALGRSGKQVELALLELKSFSGSTSDRVAVLQAAIDSVYAYFIQRELCGFPNHDGPIEHYGIPREILARLGSK